MEESSKETKLHNPEYLYDNAILSSFGGSYKQELISSMDAPMSDIIQFSTFYSTPMHSYDSFLVPDTNIKEFLALSPKNKNRSIDMIFSNFDRITPIFGMPTYFYKLKNPIYIDEKAEFMQLDFKPNSRGGFLSIKRLFPNSYG